VFTIDGRETAPAAATESLFIDPSTGKPLPFRTAVTSGLSVGVPGTLMTWAGALDRWGRFGLAEHLAPAEHRGYDVYDMAPPPSRSAAAVAPPGFSIRSPDPVCRRRRP
jgi:gamma-glutamyltranspeptidase/glutathione hydrolase